jgi:hypothetical protein
LQGVQLKDTLNVVLSPLGLTYTVNESIIWVSTPGKELQEKSPQADPSASEKSVLEYLVGFGGVRFHDIHIGRYLEIFTGGNELTVVLDQQVTTHPDYTPETYGFYYAEPEALCDSCSPETNGVIRSINLKQFTLRELLLVLCRQLNLDFRVREDKILISTSEFMSQHPVPGEFLMTPDAFATQIADAHPDEPVLEEPEVPDPSRLRLLRIVLDGKGPYGVHIYNGTQYVMLSMGVPFGDHTLMSVDLENNCCTLFSKPEGRILQLCVEPE